MCIVRGVFQQPVRPEVVLSTNSLNGQLLGSFESEKPVYEIAHELGIEPGIEQRIDLTWFTGLDC